MTALRQVADNFCRLVSSRVSIWARAKVTFSLGSLEQVGWEDFETGTAGPGVLAAFSIGEGQGFAHVPAGLAMVLVDLYLAGPGTGPYPERNLTETEAHLLSPFLAALAEGLGEAASSTFGEAHIGPITQVTGVSGLFLTNRRMQCVAVKVPVQPPSFAEPAGELTVCLPVSALRPLVAKLQPPTPKRPGADSLSAARRIPLTLALRYPPATVLLQVAQDLAPGQVLSLGHPVGQPLVLYAGDEPLFAAVPVDNGRRSACQIVGPYKISTDGD